MQRELNSIDSIHVMRGCVEGGIGGFGWFLRCSANAVDTLLLWSHGLGCTTHCVHCSSLFTTFFQLSHLSGRKSSEHQLTSQRRVILQLMGGLMRHKRPRPVSLDRLESFVLSSTVFKRICFEQDHLFD